MLKTAFKIENGRLSGSRWCPSPNYNARGVDTGIDLLVIHNISLPPAQFENGYIEAFFQNRLAVAEHPYFVTIADVTVSAHLLIARDGTVTQFVNLNDRAWHAGLSCFQGRENCNDFSIGIEMEGTDELPYSFAQYRVLAAVTLAIQQSYPSIGLDSITGHVDIAPERKTDPGESFNWPYYFQLIQD
jgi:AmpD protein